MSFNLLLDDSIIFVHKFYLMLPSSSLSLLGFLRLVLEHPRLPQHFMVLDVKQARHRETTISHSLDEVLMKAFYEQLTKSKNL